MSWIDDSDGPDGPPTERLPSALGADFPDTHPIRRHRIADPRSPRGRWLLLVTAVLILAAGGFLTREALGDGSATPAQTPSPRHPRTPAALGEGTPSLAPPLTWSPSASPSTSPSAVPTTTPGPSATAAQTSTAPPVAPPPPPPAPPAPAPTTTTSTTTVTPFVAITMEAEQGTLAGGATALACGPCSGGWRVGYVGPTASVVLRTTISQSGTRTIRVTYETDGLRQLRVQINGVLVDTRWVDGTSWDSPETFQFSATIPAGPLELRFYNDTSPAPDVDAVRIS